MTWDYYNIEKADFSFRRIISNSRGIYAKIFDKIQITPDLTNYGSALLGEALKTVEKHNIGVAAKTKIMEVVLSEPLLSAIDMMNDPKYDEEIKAITKTPITQFSDEEEEDKDEDSSVSQETITAINSLGKRAAKEMRSELNNDIVSAIQKHLKSEMSDEDKKTIDTEVKELLMSNEMSRYLSVVASAAILEIVRESEYMSLGTEGEEVEVNPDEDFPPSFYDRESTMKSWFDNVKR